MIPPVLERGSENSAARPSIAMHSIGSNLPLVVWSMYPVSGKHVDAKSSPDRCSKTSFVLTGAVEKNPVLVVLMYPSLASFETFLERKPSGDRQTMFSPPSSDLTSVVSVGSGEVPSGSRKKPGVFPKAFDTSAMSSKLHATRPDKRLEAICPGAPRVSASSSTRPYGSRVYPKSPNSRLSLSEARWDSNWFSMDGLVAQFPKDRIRNTGREGYPKTRAYVITIRNHHG